MPDLEELGGEEPLGQVVDAAVPLAPDETQVFQPATVKSAVSPI